MAVLFIIAILTTGLILIATESINKMNKAAVAMFMGVLCWLIYIGYGTHFVVAQHQIDFLSYLSDNAITSSSVKEFIATSLFFRYITRAAEVVLYLIATMSIVEVLNNNGCFDFMQEWLRTRSARRYLFVLAGMTFLLSANLDNLTSVCVMLGIMHTMVANERQRMTFGAVIVVAASCGGAFTVIGDVTSLTFWVNGLISPTAYATATALPCTAAMLTVLLLVLRSLPARLSLTHTTPPYRGDDTILTRTQRLLLLFVGIGGLWFIPTFHRITLMPPFVGALCVLSLLWIVNELCNSRLIGSDLMVRKREHQSLQYANLQHILFFIGLTLAFGAIRETGLFNRFFEWSTTELNDIYIISAGMGALSAVFNNVTTVVANISIFTPDVIQMHDGLTANYGENGHFWPLLSFSTALGSQLLSIGTMAGFALMRLEGVTLRWYVRHISGKVLAGWLVGLFVFWIINEWW